MDLKFILLALSLLTLEVFGLMFDLQPNGRKCLREEVQKDVLVTGDYEISEVAGQRTDLKVIFPSIFQGFIVAELTAIATFDR